MVRDSRTSSRGAPPSDDLPAFTDPREFSSPPGRRTGTPWFVVVLSVAVMAAAVATISVRTPDSVEATVLRYAYAPGETRTYDLQMDMQVDPPEGIPEAQAEGPIEGRVTATMTMTVVEVRDDGSAVVDVTVSNVTSSGFPPGADPFPTQGQTTRMTIAPDGRVLEVEGDGGLFSLPGSPGSLGGLAGGQDPSSAGNSQFFFPTFPSDEIGPGDTWSETFTEPMLSEEDLAEIQGEGEVPPGFEELMASFEDAELTYTVDGRHDGFEETAFGRAAKIHQRIEVPMDLRFPIGAFFGAFAAGMGEAFGSDEPVPTMPPGLAEAAMVFDGLMAMEGDSLVLLSDGDAVEFDGTMDMDMTFRAENFPPELQDGGPDEFSIVGTVDMKILRTS